MRRSQLQMAKRGWHAWLRRRKGAGLRSHRRRWQCGSSERQRLYTHDLLRNQEKRQISPLTAACTAFSYCVRTVMRSREKEIKRHKERVNTNSQHSSGAPYRKQARSRVALSPDSHKSQTDPLPNPTLRFTMRNGFSGIALLLTLTTAWDARRLSTRTG